MSSSIEPTAAPLDDAQELHVEPSLAEPAEGTIMHSAGYDLAICEHCDGDLMRVAPDPTWDHMDSARRSARVPDLPGRAPLCREIEGWRVLVGLS